jgi:hypothetical protein
VRRLFAVTTAVTMLGQLALRFLLGGLIVALASVVGELFKPKTFSGIFGAAPSVAMASLALAYGEHGAAYVRVDGRSMVIGAVALCCYSAACVTGTRREHWPVWLCAGLAWVVWLAVAFGLWSVARAAGVLR